MRCRFLCGVAVGSDLVVSTAYVAEISKRDVRGALGFLVQLMGALGVLYTFALGCFLDWKWLAAANAAWAAPFWVAVLASPESPRLLLAREEFEFNFNRPGQPIGVFDSTQFSV